MSDTLLPVPEEWRERAFIDRAKYDEMYARSIADPDGFWAEQARRIDWIAPFTKVKNVSWDPRRSPYQMVRGRVAERQRELHRPSPCRARRPDRDIVGRRRSGGEPRHHVSRAARTGLPLRQRAQGPWREEGRPRYDLPADDPRDRLCDARLRADRRGTFGDLRGLLSRFHRRAHPGLRLHRRHHGGRRSARRQAHSAQSQHRSGLAAMPRGEKRDRGAPYRQARAHARGPRRPGTTRRWRRFRPIARASR